MSSEIPIWLISCKGENMKISKADFRKCLAIFFSITALTYMAATTFLTVPEANVDKSNIILGFLITTALSTIIGFYFGSSEIEEPNKP